MLKKISKMYAVLKLAVIYSWEEYHFLIPPKELYKGIGKLFSSFNKMNKYELWIKTNEKAHDYKKFEYNPLISIVIPHYNTDPQYLKECVESILNQSYKNFEICIADDCSSNKESIGLLKKYEEEYPQIKVVWRKENGNISAATNSAIEVATGEFIAFMDSDDVLSQDALYWNVEALNNNKNLDLIYSDEDKLDFDGNRVQPHFKSDWNPDLLLSLNYICHFVVARATLVKELGGCRSQFDGAQDYDFLLRLTEKTDNIYHISRMLYHWRIIHGSTALSIRGKPYIIEAWKNVIEETLKRRKLRGKLIPSEYKPFHILFENNNEKVSILILVDDNSKYLKYCIESIYKNTMYKNFEVVLINCNVDKKKIFKYLIECERKFDNLKVLKNSDDIKKVVTGEYLIFLHSNTKILEANWIEYMLGYARQERIGFVSANLLRNNNFISEIKEEFTPKYRYFITSNYDGINFSCTMISKKKYSSINNMFFDECNDKQLYNEILKLGYRNVYMPVVKINQI